MDDECMSLIPAAWQETSAVNSYGEGVRAHVIRSMRDGGLRYRCRDDKWVVAFSAWVRSRREGQELPEPFSEAHNMFLDPIGYGCVPLGASDAAKRRAVRRIAINDLDGWDREMRQTVEGMRRLAKIVRQTVAARMSGVELGSTPYVACVLSSL